MYDDASYYSFSQSIPAHEEKSHVSKHQRKQSLLKQPHEEFQADVGLLDGVHEVSEPRNVLTGPPAATVRRRAQSYSDFHDAAKAALSQDYKVTGGEEGREGTQYAVKNELDFLKWYQATEQDLLEASHEEYIAYQSQLETSEAHLDSLLFNTSSTLDLLASLSTSFKAVEAQTTAFRKQCEELLSEQSRLTTLANDLNHNLKYYSYLEPITRRLNAPGAGTLVKGKEFSHMLTRLDECLDYMAKHPSQKEAPFYQSRYRLLMTRGLTLIRVYFVGTLREIASDVTKRIADRQLNDTTMSALLYAKFRFGASELKEVAQEIRKRTVIASGTEAGAVTEYQSLMNDLYVSYSATRGKLVIPLVRKRIGDIAMSPSSSKDLIAFARSSIGYVRGICSDEYGLWREWFEGDDGLYEFLESVCEPLYDHLRPRIIHEIKLPKLCELCTLLQTRYIRDQDEDVEPPEANQLDFSTLIRQALEDAQTRLVFRAQAILRDDIENFRPKPADLDYPARNRHVSLSGSKTYGPATSGRKGSIAEPSTPVPKDPMIIDEGDSPSGRWGFDTEAALKGWYPTLRKAIWLLSRIYRLVNSTVFDDLAHQIVHQTTVSLHSAANQINSKATKVDGQLFLIKHLLILKQQIVAFDIEYVTPDISFDFSAMTNTFWELRQRGGLFDPRNYWQFVSGGLLPRVVENMLDAKVELDGRLRTVINAFTNSFATRMTGFISEGETGKKDFKGGVAVKDIQKMIEKEVPLLRRKLDEYLDDIRTKETLVGSVQDQVIQNYETFYDRHAEKTKSNGTTVSKKGKGRDDEVWDPDTLAHWAGGIFRVGNLGLLYEGDESTSRTISRAGTRPGRNNLGKKLARVKTAKPGRSALPTFDGKKPLRKIPRTLSVLIGSASPQQASPTLAYFPQVCLADCPTLDHVSGIALPQNNTFNTPGDATSCQRQDCHLVIVVSYQPPEGNSIGLKLNRTHITFGMSHLTPPNSTHSTPKRKRGAQDSGYPSPLISRLKTDNLPNRSNSSPEHSDEASPRSVVAGRLQDLKLQPQDHMSNLDLLTPPSGRPSPLKRKAANVSFDFTHAYQSIEPTDSSKPIVHFKLPPSPESPVLEIPETPRLTPLRSPSESPARQYAAIKSKSKSRSPPAPKVPTALWWTDSEITGHDPSDPTDDGYGINGVGFVPTPAMANARSERRRRQVAEWKMREAREARQKRSERRWNRDVNIGTVGETSGLEVSEERRVRFLEV